MLTQSAQFDLGVAIRSLRRSPGFLAAAVVSLGLAIGAGIAGFTVLDAVRFRAFSPLPQKDKPPPPQGSVRLTRVNQLKQRLEQMPDKKIPELQLLTDKDWFDAVKNAKTLETDDDFRRSRSSTGYGTFAF